jgi:hypothetical protein
MSLVTLGTLIQVSGNPCVGLHERLVTRLPGLGRIPPANRSPDQ